jgi:folate-binding protein YgfZ
MTEVIAEQQSIDLPLVNAHRELGARFIDVDGWLLPAMYGNSNDEYLSVREKSAGLIDLSARGRVRVSGSEALLFLNGLLTNDMKTLGDNQWMSAIFPNVQGRFLAAVRIAKLESSYLIDTEAVTTQKVLQLIERFTLAGDFKVSDETSGTVQLSVQGKTAAEIVESALGFSISDGTERGAQQFEWREKKISLIHSSHTGEKGVDLIVGNELARDLWSALHDAGAVPVGYETFETLRIEAGIPRYGRDMDESNVVTETNLEDAVSFTKGCYIGQEIIIRIKHRGHVAKKLTGLTAEDIVDSNSVINSSEGKEIGKTTSATFSPSMNKFIALGYVRYEYLAPGTEVMVSSNGKPLAARVTELPFIDESKQNG